MPNVWLIRDTDEEKIVGSGNILPGPFNLNLPSLTNHSKMPEIIFPLKDISLDLF